MRPDTTPIKRNRTNDLNFLSRLYLTLSTDNDQKRSISSGLKIIGTHLNVDRLHVLAVHNNMTFSVLHEWCGEGIPAVGDKLKTHPIVISRSMAAELNKRNYITIDGNSEETDADLRNLLSTYACRHIILLPLFGADSYFAFLTAEQCQGRKEQREEEIRLLEIAASAVASNIRKNNMINSLQHQLEDQRKKGLRTDAQISQFRHHIESLHSDWKSFRDRPHTSEKWGGKPELNSFEERLEQLHRLSHSSSSSVI